MMVVHTVKQGYILRLEDGEVIPSTYLGGLIQGYEYLPGQNAPEEANQPTKDRMIGSIVHGFKYILVSAVPVIHPKENEFGPVSP